VAEVEVSLQWDKMRKLKKKALAHRYFKNRRHTMLTRVDIIGISRVGWGLGHVATERRYAYDTELVFVDADML
jgi:hypothetical protein